jgi:hypothetical protein
MNFWIGMVMSVIFLLFPFYILAMVLYRFLAMHIPLWRQL